MKAIINIHLKKGVLDPAGKATMHSLEALGFNNISNVNIGKQIIIDLDEKDISLAKKQIDDMCAQLLVNDVIESYELKIEE